MLGLGVRDTRAERLEERLPRLDETDPLRGVGGAIVSASQLMTQCAIDAVFSSGSSDTGWCVFLSASSVRANDSEDACDDCVAGFDTFDGCEWGGDVRRVSGLAGRSLRRFEIWLGHRDCCTVSTSNIECFIPKSKS